MRRILLAIGLWSWMLAVPVLAADDDQVAAAQAVITAQIEAMRVDDKAKAYSYASPDIQLKFPNPDIFMAMVKSGYAPVYRPRAYAFAQASVEGGVVTQLVDISAADGSDWIAEYRLAPMADGSLKIISCQLRRAAGESA